MTKRVVGTVITKSFLAHARTLAESLTEHNPDVELYVLLADRIDNYFEPDLEPFHLIQLADLPECDLVEQMCFYYTPFELCCALRGYLHEYIVHHTAAESWIFLDADIMVFHSLDTVFQRIEEASIVLTPHLQSLPTLTIEANVETIIITAGLYNAGFIGLKRTEETFKFITWFKQRLQNYCFNDVAIEYTRGLFVDQRWLDLVPLYFKDVSLLLDAGANLGHWNLYKRHLELDTQGKIFVDQEPLLFVHFSGWDISNPHQISKWYSWLYEEQSTSSPWAVLADHYREKLLKNGYETTTQYPYAFGEFHDGTSITLPIRRAYHDEVMQGAALEGSPFNHAEYFQAKPYSIYSTHFLQGELDSARHYASQLQQHVEQLQNAQREAQTAAEKAQQHLEHTQAELHYTYENLQATQAELHYTYENLQATQAELHHTHENLQTTQAELHHFHEVVQTIESSIFWKLRTLWWKLKQSLGSPPVSIFESKVDQDK